jgi:hypothetical protein
MPLFEIRILRRALSFPDKKEIPGEIPAAAHLLSAGWTCPSVTRFKESFKCASYLLFSVPFLSVSALVCWPPRL